MTIHKVNTYDLDKYTYCELCFLSYSKLVYEKIFKEKNQDIYPKYIYQDLIGIYQKITIYEKDYNDLEQFLKCIDKFSAKSKEIITSEAND